MLKNGDQTKKGFTLIELCVVVAIVAILAAIAIPAFMKIKEQASARVCQTNRDTFMRQYQILAATQSGSEKAVTLQQALSGEYSVKIGDIHLNICPKHGEIYAADDQKSLRCRIHDDGATGEGSNGNTSSDSTSTSTDQTGKIDLLKNHIYDVPVYDINRKYEKGDVVIGLDGTIYSCTRPDLSGAGYGGYAPGTAWGWHAWKVVGHSEGKAIEMDGTQTYSFTMGTTVKYNGRYYLYAPLYGDDRSNSFAIPTQTDYWVDITDCSKQYIKPNKASNAYQYYATYQKGDIVWYRGKEYVAKTDLAVGQYPAEGVANSFWSPH